MKLSQLPKRTSLGNYAVDVDLSDLIYHIERYKERHGLVLNPDFQRGHVWTEQQQIDFCEFIVSGGRTSEILFNHVGWQRDWKGEFVCVDGLQRITALLRMINNEIPVYGHKLEEFEDSVVFLRGTGIKMNINNLKTREEVLRWYLELNDGGTPHTQEEIERVRKMYNDEVKK